jgi:hemolysin activation/secretion protein
MKFVRTLCPFLAVISIFSASFVLAQTQPDAGALRQQIEKDQSEQLRSKIPLKRVAPPPAMSAPVGAIVTVKTFRFAGNTLLSAEQLSAVLNEYLNRPLGFNQLQAAAAAVANAYREAGWIVRAYLPKQDVTDGIVVIQIVEAVFGGARIEGGSLVGPARISSIVDAHQKKGDLLSAWSIERALLIADDLPGINVVGGFNEGKADGETDLIVRVTDEPRATGDVTIDNTGLRAMGREKIAANANVNSPLGLGDLLAGSLIATRGSEYGRVGYSMPLGANGWRVGANVSNLVYKLVASELSALESKGRSNASGLDLSYPVLRSALRNINFSLNYDHKTFDNESLGATSSSYAVNALGVGLNGSFIDSFGGGGANSASVTVVDGSVKLDGSPNQAADAITTSTAGHYRKLRYSLGRQQILNNDWSLSFSLSGQFANKNVDSSEKFFLGGSSGVRAYPTNEGGGSEGLLSSVELRWRVAESLTATSFFDWGRIKMNKKNDYSGASALNEYILKGAGASIGWQANAALALKAVYAHRIGDNPNPTTSGYDQDGSLQRNRFWLTANLRF